MVATALAAAGVAVFVVIAEDLADGGGLVSHDQAVLTWFLDHRTEAWVRAAKVVSAFGGFAFLSIAALLVAVWLWARRWRSALAFAPLTALLLASLASTTAKAYFGRDRPPMTVRATAVTLAAFPSGHATDAAAFFLATSFVLAITIASRRYVQVVLVAGGTVAAGLVGVSRLVLGVHWLSDVIAGWALGATIAITVVVALWYLVSHRQTMTRGAIHSE